MKKCIAVLIIVLLCILSACGGSPEQSPEVSEKPQDSIGTDDNNNKASGPQYDTASPIETDSLDVVLHSSDTQFVVKMSNLYTIYYLDGENVVGMSTYCSYETKQLASELAKQSTPDVDSSVEACFISGNAVLIKYKPQSYAGLTLSMLNSFYETLKVN